MKKIIIAISCCIVVLLLGFCGYRGYQVWKENHLMSLAKIFATRADSRNELLCLQQVLRVNPRNLEACRRMAALSEADRSPSAMIWRERVVELAPDSLDDRLALAQTALIFRDLTTANSTLMTVSEADRKTPSYQNIAGVVAASQNQTAEAEKYFTEAARLEPWNTAPQLNLAVVRLHGSNSLDIAAARIDLKRISLNATNAAFRVQAMRELVADALRFKDLDNALTLATDLARQTNAIFADKLLRLDILREVKSPDYASALAVYQQEAAKDAANLSDMATWLMVRSKPSIALNWLQSLPTNTQTNQPGALLLAECQALMQNWGDLQDKLKNQDWADLEFLRHAFMSRALLGENLSGASAAEWDLAFKQASDNKSKLIQLFRLAAGWTWLNEGEQILWTIVNRYPEEKWAGDSLQQALIMAGRTRPLMQFYSLQLKRNPNDPKAKNDLAMTAMLLDAEELNPFDLSKAAYDADPKNPSYASTYAFGLYLQKQNADALKVMQQLPPAVLNDPGVAGYYGLILKANGVANANTYLNLALAKSLMLPEEKKMFEQAAK
jgi:hypothetical protein